MKKKRSGCGAIAHPQKPNTIIVVGGCNNNDMHLRCCEMVCLDQTEQGQTRRVPSMMTPRAHHALVLVEDRFVVAMGGESNGSRAISSVEYLDLEEEAQEQQQWRPLPSMETARSLFAAFYCSENHKIVVVGGVDNVGQMLDTVEELPVLFRGHARSSRPLREPPRPRIQQLLDEMKRFLESINEREGVLIQERDENRRLCNEYIAQVSERLRQARCQARAILSCMHEIRGTSWNPTNVPAPAAVSGDRAAIAPHQDLRQPPALTKTPPGHMDADHLQKIEQWIKETDQKKDAYVDAVDTREVEIERELDENRRAREDYVAEIRAVVAPIDNPNTARNPQPGPGNVAAGIPPEINLGPAFGFNGLGSLDGGAQSIRSRLTDGDDAMLLLRRLEEIEERLRSVGEMEERLRRVENRQTDR